MEKIKNMIKHPFYGKKIILVFCLMLLLSLLLMIEQSGQKQEMRNRAATVNCTPPSGEEVLNSEEQAFLTLINDYRIQNGAQALKISPTLSKSAAWLSSDMNTNNYMGHIDSLGRDYIQRITDCGYSLGGGENVAQGYATPQEVFDVWKNSTEGHNEEMLDPLNIVVGIAKVGNYWTLHTGVVDDSQAVIPSSGPTQELSPTLAPSLITPTYVCAGGVNCVPSPTIFNQPTIDPNITPTTEPTLQPTNLMPTQEPTDDPNQADPTTEPTLDPGNPVPAMDQNPASANKDIIQILLGLILMIFQFMTALFSGGH